MILLASIISLMLLGCAASAPKISIYASLDSIDCPNASDFKGTAVSLSEQEALDMARAAISGNIQSRLDASNESFRKQIGDKLTESTWQQQIIQTSSLQNAQDAKLHKTERRKDSVGVVACMSRADAAKGFEERQRLVADSLELVSRILPSIKHPKQKNEAWSRTQRLWNEFARLQVMLDGFGVARADLFSSVSEMHLKTREDYKNYCQEQRVYWADSENEYSNAVFAELSKRIMMEKSKCVVGLNLRFDGLAKCASSALGAECAFEPSLAIESCNGELYSVLKSTGRIAGYDARNRNKAKANLIMKLSSADFFKEWETEIKGWIPQCIE